MSKRLPIFNVLSGSNAVQSGLWSNSEINPDKTTLELPQLLSARALFREIFVVSVEELLT
jgi:hypothetical protein